MKTKSLAFGILLAFLTEITAGAVIAQDGSVLTAEQMEQLFAKQVTRGLSIIPVNQDEATTNSETTNVVVEPAYVPVAKPDGVNIQVKFDFDSAFLRDDQKSKLTTLCQVMQTVDVKLFQIAGHTDSSGAADYNKKLSLLRAKEVKRYLVNDCGIADGRLVIIGVGEASPIDADDPSSGVNRRVEFQALS